MSYILTCSWLAKQATMQSKEKEKGEREKAPSLFFPCAIPLCNLQLVTFFAVIAGE
jgi:hypothetical protein